jgi:hypothetical protein
MSETVTARELQTLRNMGNEAEAAADEIDALRAELEALQPGIDHLRETCDALERERVIAERDALRAEVERMRVQLAWTENQFRQINDWCCYATEEDIAARLMALQQIGVLARAALTPAEEAK